MKRILSMMLAGMMMVCGTSITAFAASNETTDTVTVSGNTENSESEDTSEEAETEAMTEAEVQEQINVTESEDGTVTFSFGDWEWTMGEEDDEPTKTGTVTDVGSYLHLRNGAGMNYDIIGHLLPGAQVEVIGEDGDWYQVVVPEQTGYVHSDYLRVVENAKSSDDVDENMLGTLLYMMMLSANGENGVSLTPDGNLTLVDDIGSTSGAGQQFLTFVTKSGNTFYMIIDRNDKGEENVHFLNLVDEADLLALMDEDAATQIKTTTETEEPVVTEKPAETEEPIATDEPETEKKKSPVLALLVLFLVGVGGVGGFLYFKMNGKNPTAKQDVPDPDADYEDEEETYDLPDEEDESADEYDEETEDDPEEDEE